MKRYNGLHDKLCTIENIEVADDNARKNKNKKYGILELILLEMVKLITLIVEIKLYFILYIDLIISLLILKLLNMTGVFMLKIEKKKLNLKHNIL